MKLPILRLTCAVLSLTAGLSFCVQVATAGPKKVSRSGMPIATGEPVPPHSPTGNERFRRYLFDAFGPIGWLRAAASGAVAQADNDPPEWGQGAKGYGRRVGSEFGQHVVQETVLYGFSAPFGQDPTYYRCECSGFLPRLGHAIVSSFTALNRDDNRVFSVPRVVAPFAAGQVAANGWYPDRFGPKDGLRMGTISLGAGVGVNVIKEFIAGGRKHP